MLAVGLVADGRGDDVAGRQRRAVVDGDDPAQVVLVADHDRREALDLAEMLAHRVDRLALRGVVELVVERALLGEDDELGEVEGVRALAQDRALGALLAAGRHEGAGVLEVRTLDHLCQRLVRAQRAAVAGEDVADLALGDRDQRVAVDAVQERAQEVDAGAEDVGLVARLAVEGDDLVLQRPATGPPLLDDADLARADDPDADDRVEQPDGEQDEDDDHERADGAVEVGEFRHRPSVRGSRGRGCWLA